MDYMDYIGRQFGKLTVMKFAGYKTIKGEPHRRAAYLCKCSCGKEAIITRHQLQMGKRTSCGNCTEIIRHDDYCEYVCENGESFIFDTEDIPFVQGKRWHMNGNGYAITSENYGSEVLSRLLLQSGKDVFVDHINGNRADNRRQNLRIASISENNHNMILPSHNTSGFKGVSYYAPRGKYRAYIKISGKRKHLGYFDNKEDAARAYDTAARFYHGKFACVNFPQPGEQGCRRNQTA